MNLISAIGCFVFSLLLSLPAKADIISHKISVLDADSKEPIPHAFVIYSVSEWIPGDGWTHGEHPKWHKYRAFISDDKGVANIEELDISKTSWRNSIQHAIEGAFSRDHVYSSTNLKNGNRLLRDGVTTIYLKPAIPSTVAGQLLTYFVHMNPDDVVINKPMAQKILLGYDLSEVRPKINLDKLSEFIRDTK